MEGTTLNQRFALALILFAGYFVTFGILTSPSQTPVAIPTPIDVSKIDFSKISPADIEATETHRDQLREDVSDAQKKVAAVISSQGSSIADIQRATLDAKESFEEYRKTSEATIKRGNAAIVAYDYVNKKNHRAQWVLIALWSALVALIYTKVPLLLKQYAIWGGLVAIAAGSTFIFLWL